MKPVLSSGVLQEQTNEDCVVKLNVGGTIFQTKLKTLTDRCEGRLSRLSPKIDAYNPQTGEYFFDQDPLFFKSVLQFYRTGSLHLTQPFCFKTVQDEMSFWGLGLDTIGGCCWMNYCKIKEQWENQNELITYMGSHMSTGHSGKCLSVKQQIWIALEYPVSSLPAKIWTILSVILLGISITCYGLTTLPASKRMYPTKGNNSQWSTAEVNYSKQFVYYVAVADVCCLLFFTVEFILRLVCAPGKSELFKSFLFYCDIFFLVPGWLLDVIILTQSDLLVKIATYSKLAMFIMQFLTVTRVFRVFRLAWFSQGVKVLFYVLKASIKELLLLGVFVCIGTLIYGFLIYTAEVTENEKFTNAFAGFWWAIITMSTVGYGDFVPVTIAGYVIAALCAISGLIILSMPIPIIAGNFNLYYGFRVREGQNDCTKKDKNSVQFLSLTKKDAIDNVS